VKRITERLPDDLDARLHRAAARRESTVANVIRQAIEVYLAEPRRLIAAKAARSGHRDTARRIEEIIRQSAGRSC
jgi:predicted transcriptional regulator